MAEEINITKNDSYQVYFQTESISTDQLLPIYAAMAKTLDIDTTGSEDTPVYWDGTTFKTATKVKTLVDNLDGKPWLSTTYDSTTNILTLTFTTINLK